MTYNEILQNIISRLGDNYVSTDENVLKDILTDKIRQASIISNREIEINATEKDDNLLYLSPEIIEASIISYCQRGVEYTKSLSQLGISNSFVDVNELLRNNIIKNGKRVVW